MKLLSKSDIDKAKALDRKREVDEGFKLAKRVDSLREIHAQEEASLEKFRNYTVAEINKDITELSQKRDKLASDVESLEKKKLDDPVFAEIKVEKDKILAKEKEINSLNFQIQAKIKELEHREEMMSSFQDNLELQQQTINEKNKKSQKNLETTESLKYEASRISQDAQDKKDKIEKEVGEKVKMLLAKEASIAVKERELKMQIEKIARDEMDLAVREQALKDKYETLERTIKRINKKSQFRL